MSTRLLTGWTRTHVWLAAFAVFGLFLPPGFSGLVFLILFMIGVARYTATTIAPQTKGDEPETRAAERPVDDRRTTIRAAAPQPQTTRSAGRSADSPWGHLSSGPTAGPATRLATASEALFAQAPHSNGRGFDADPASQLGRKPASPSPALHAFAPGTPAQPSPRPTSFPRRLLGKLHPQAYAYLRAFLGFLLTLGALSALKAGVDPSTGPMATLSILFPTAYMAAVTSPILIPIIMAVTKFVRALGVRRGWSDALVGVIMTSIYWLPFLLDAPSKGAMSAASAAGIAFSGAMGGFEFWRAEGYPEARRSTARLLGTFKDGFMQGLGR